MSLKIGGLTLRNRLILGTGKFGSMRQMQDTIISSQSEMITLSLKRISKLGNENITEFLPKNLHLLPNTSGVNNAREAVLLAQMARELLGTNYIKLEIHPEQNYLLPDPIETYLASELLVREGFFVLAYINADPMLALRLQEIGVAAVMPLGSPIGSNNGLKTKDQIKIIIEQASVPVIIDAGIGKPSEACEAMEMGADAVMINTAIAVANDPVAMAKAFDLAIKAGRAAYEAGLASNTPNAIATSNMDTIFSGLE